MNFRKNNESSEKKSEIVSRLIEIFFSTSKPLKMDEFIVQNRQSLVKLHPAFFSVETMVCCRFSENLLRSDLLFQTVERDMSQTCEELQSKLAQLETYEHFKDIVEEIIPHHTEHLSMGKKIDNEIVKRQIFRKLIGHLLWLFMFFRAYIFSFFRGEGVDDDLRVLYYDAFSYYKTNLELWRELAKIPNEIDLNRDIINEALYVVADSLHLRIRLAKIEIDNGNKYEVQEIIDRTLISFADEGFEFKPNEWIKAAEEASSNEIINHNKCCHGFDHRYQGS